MEYGRHCAVRIITSMSDCVLQVSGYLSRGTAEVSSLRCKFNDIVTAYVIRLFLYNMEIRKQMSVDGLRKCKQRKEINTSDRNPD